MIDLHSHILPGIDDGAGDISVSLEMAKAWVADGVTVVACTPHILPGLYQNSGPLIRSAVQQLQNSLDQAGIPLRLATGCDAHMVPTFVADIRSGQILTIADSRYVLVEPPHHIEPPQIEDFFFNLLVAGYVPILTHPERLSWVPSRYDTIRRLVKKGVWMQVTAGSITGAFGRNAQYWAERMLNDGCVHVLATDAHDNIRRPPRLGKGWEAASRQVGAAEAEHLVRTRPAGVLNNEAPSNLPIPVAAGDISGVAHADADSRSKTGTTDGVGREERRGASRTRSGGILGRLQRFFE